MEVVAALNPELLLDIRPLTVTVVAGELAPDPDPAGECECERSEGVGSRRTDDPMPMCVDETSLDLGAGAGGGRLALLGEGREGCSVGSGEGEDEEEEPMMDNLATGPLPLACDCLLPPSEPEGRPATPAGMLDLRCGGGGGPEEASECLLLPRGGGLVALDGGGGRGGSGGREVVEVAAVKSTEEEVVERGGEAGAPLEKNCWLARKGFLPVPVTPGDLTSPELAPLDAPVATVLLGGGGRGELPPSRAETGVTGLETARCNPAPGKRANGGLMDCPPASA